MLAGGAGVEVRRRAGAAVSLAAQRPARSSGRWPVADPIALTEHDQIEGGARRWRTLGVVDGYGVLLVAHTVLDEDKDGEAVEIFRIISARTADRMERRRYEETTRWI